MVYIQIKDRRGVFTMNTTTGQFPETNPWASDFHYGALVDAEGNEQPITENMVRSACQDAMSALFAFLPQRIMLQQQQANPA